MRRRRRVVLALALAVVATPIGHAFGQTTGSTPDSRSRLERSETPSPGTTSDGPRPATSDPALRRPAPDLRQRVVIPPAVTVPDLNGRTVRDAGQLVEGAQLLFSVGDRRPGSGDVDTVIGQKPAAGERVAPGTTVTVIVALAAPRVIVPELRGRPVFEAERLVARLGLRLSVAGRRPGDGSVESIVEQKPSPGTPSSPGSTVSVVVRAPGGSAPGGTSDGPARQDPAPRVAVPDLTGRTVDVAAQILARSRLRLDVAQQRSEGGAAGTIIEQKPRAGDRVPPGATVAVTVVAPPRPVTVPDLRGLLLADAERVLARSRLQLGIADRRAGDGRTNSVVEQKPGAGTEVKPGSTVSVVVLVPGTPPAGGSQGEDGRGTREPTPRVVVPDVRGRPLEAAARLLEQSRLRLDVVGRRQESGGDGTIVEQEPLPGDRVVAGSAVAVIVVTAPPPVVVPDVRGRSLVEAQRILARTRLGLTIAERRTGDGPGESVIDQRPPAGSRVEPGSTVRLAVLVPPAPPPATTPRGERREPPAPTPPGRADVPVTSPPPGRADVPVTSPPPGRGNAPVTSPPAGEIRQPPVPTPPLGRRESPPAEPPRGDPPPTVTPSPPPTPDRPVAEVPAARPVQEPTPASDPAPIVISETDRGPSPDTESVMARLPLSWVIAVAAALLVGVAAGAGVSRWRTTQPQSPTPPSLRVVASRDLAIPELMVTEGSGHGVDIRLRAHADPGEQTVITHGADPLESVRG